MQTTVIVDADTLLFSAASVSEQRSIEVLHEPTGVVKEFKNKTEFKSLMKSKNKEITTDYVITDKQVPEPLENCLHLVKSQAQKIIDTWDFCEVIFCAGDSNNFRLDLPLPTRYKSNRKDMIRPIWLKEAHKYFSHKFNSRKAEFAEADDLVMTLANDEVRKGNKAVILSHDKDTNQAIGCFIGDYTATPDSLQYVQSMHEAVLTPKKEFKSFGVPWITYQCLKGDISDGYRPTELCGIKYGDVSAYNDLKHCKTEQELLLKVIEKYQQWYPSKFVYTDWSGKEHEADWKSMLRLYFSCAKMKTSHDDKLLADEFFNQYGVEL
jgi:5'-3' exonuclease